MFSNQSAEVNLETPISSLEAVQGDRVTNRFLAGSCSVGEPNSISVLRFHSSLNELGIDVHLEHATGPVGVICCNPNDAKQVLTVAQESQTATLWSIAEEVILRDDEPEYNPEGGGTVEMTHPQDEDHALEQVATLVDFEGEGPIVDMSWRFTGNDFGDPPADLAGGSVLSLDRVGRVTLWDMEALQTVKSSTAAKETTTNRPRILPPRMAWDPHNPETVAVTSGEGVRLLDWRTDTAVASDCITEITRAHRYGACDVDFNPNKPHVLSTSGQDGLLKFWDLRQDSRPLLLTARGGHSHYASRVKYNPFHDQLVLSCGTDAVVNLWRASSISSAPLLDEDGEQNVRVLLQEHGDAAVALSWGAADAWVYMSAAYDGKVRLNHVPSKEKYKILL